MNLDVRQIIYVEMLGGGGGQGAHSVPVLRASEPKKGERIEAKNLLVVIFLFSICVCVLGRFILIFKNLDSSANL